MRSGPEERDQRGDALGRGDRGDRGTPGAEPGPGGVGQHRDHRTRGLPGRAAAGGPARATQGQDEERRSTSGSPRPGSPAAPGTGRAARSAPGRSGPGVAETSHPDIGEEAPGHEGHRHAARSAARRRRPPARPRGCGQASEPSVTGSRMWVAIMPRRPVPGRRRHRPGARASMVESGPVTVSSSRGLAAARPSPPPAPRRAGRAPGVRGRHEPDDRDESGVDHTRDPDGPVRVCTATSAESRAMGGARESPG